MNKQTMFLALRVDQSGLTPIAAFDNQHDADMWVGAQYGKSKYKVRVALAQVGFGYPAQECELMDLYYVEALGHYVLRAMMKSFQPLGIQWLYDCQKSVSVPVKFEYKE